MLIQLLVAFVILIIVTTNYIYFKFNKKYESKNNPSQSFISLIVPMRNEESNAKGIIDSLLTQTYPNIEVIIVNDNSTDNTSSILNEYSRITQKLKVIEINNLPDSWKGKNYANWIGVKHINPSTDFIIFTDADVRFEPDAIKRCLELIESKKFSILSIFPNQVTESFFEKLIIPMYLGFFPLLLYPFYFSKFIPSFIKNFLGVILNGQFIMINKDDYFKIGGHEKIKNKKCDDLSLGKLAGEFSLNILVSYNTKIINCRMYHNLNEIIKGFAKISTCSSVRIFLGIMILFFTFIFPYILLFSGNKFQFIPIILSLIAIFISIQIYDDRKRFTFALFPISMCAMLIIYIIGIYGSFFSRNLWKGRTV